MTDELAERAKDAAPGAPAGEHLGEAALVALRARGDDERDEDEDAYRHLASCAACRARMASLAKGESAAVQRIAHVEPEKAERAPAKVITMQRRSVAKPLAMLAAAAVLIFAVTSLLRGSSEGLEVRTRSYAGTMGSGDAANVAPGDKNVEVYFESKDPVAARLIVLDEKGKKLAPPREFTREGTKMRVVVAPRTFTPHEGKAQGFVVAGTEAIVAATSDEAMALPDLTEKRLETIAKRQGAWFAKVDL